LVTVFETIPVAVFWASTSAPATFAPVVSVTIPVIFAVGNCAAAVKASKVNM
jgi:hypothetical protein